MLDSLPDGVTLANAAGRIVFSNRAADRILGVGAATGAPPEEWGEHYGTFMPDGKTPFPPEQYPLLRALRGEHPREVEMLIRNDVLVDGALISVSGQPLRDENQKLIGAAVVFRDITELRRAQRELEKTIAELERAQRMKDELATFIVHDLKNPLSSIVTTCELLAAAGPQAGQVHEDVAAIHEAAARAHRMVMDPLDVQLAEDGAIQLERSRVPLAQLMADVREAILPRLAGTRQRIVLADAGELAVVGDRSLLFRVLMNLVDNCVKYGPPGGTIWMEAAPGAPGTAIISVRDEGPGVRPDLRERIFERYAPVEREEGQRSKDSRGLGLRFCKVVLDAHEGRIWAEDATPHGARFCVEMASA